MLEHNNEQMQMFPEHMNRGFHVIINAKAASPDTCASVVSRHQMVAADLHGNVPGPSTSYSIHLNSIFTPATFCYSPSSSHFLLLISVFCAVSPLPAVSDSHKLHEKHNKQYVRVEIRQPDGGGDGSWWWLRKSICIVLRIKRSKCRSERPRWLVQGRRQEQQGALYMLFD